MIRPLIPSSLHLCLDHARTSELDYIPINLHPAEHQAMRGSTPSLGRTRSSSNARPNHIPLPPNNTGSNGNSNGGAGGFFNRSSGPGTPTSPNGQPFGTSSSNNGNNSIPGNGMSRGPSNGDAPLASPSSPRNSFLPSFMQRSRPRSSTLTRLGSYQNSGGNSGGGVNTAAGVAVGGALGSGSGSRPVSSRAASTNDLGRSVSQPPVGSAGKC